MKLDLPPTFSVVGRKMGVRLKNGNAHLTHINFFCLYAMTTDHFSPEALTYEVRKLTLQKKKAVAIIGKPAEQVLKHCTVFGLSPSRTRWILVKDFLEAYSTQFGANMLIDKRFVDLCIKIPATKFESMVTADGNLGSGCRIGTAQRQTTLIVVRRHDSRSHFQCARSSYRNEPLQYGRIACSQLHIASTGLDLLPTRTASRRISCGMELVERDYRNDKNRIVIFYTTPTQKPVAPYGAAGFFIIGYPQLSYPPDHLFPNRKDFISNYQTGI